MTTIHCYPFPTDWSDTSIVLEISDASRASFEAIPKGEEHSRNGIVAFDSKTRKYWAIRRFPCFADSWECCCAAQAKELSKKSEKWRWPAVEFLANEDE